MEIVKLLLHHGANVNQLNNYKETPMFFAARGGKKEIIKILVDHGANASENAFMEPVSYFSPSMLPPICA